jgi:hypothetical protein
LLDHPDHNCPAQPYLILLKHHSVSALLLIPKKKSIATFSLSEFCCRRFEGCDSEGLQMSYLGSSDHPNDTRSGHYAYALHPHAGIVAFLGSEASTYGADPHKEGLPYFPLTAPVGISSSAASERPITED